MKKYFALLCVAVALFAAGCGKKEPAPSSTPAAPPADAPTEEPAK